MNDVSDDEKRSIAGDVLRAYMSHLEHTWPFTSDEYPLMPDPETEPCAATAFAINHVLLHIMKGTGSIATSIEYFDHHGNTWVNGVDTKQVVKKQFANVLRLAALLGMEPGDLIEYSQS